MFIVIRIAVYSEDAQDLDTLTKESDVAMYYAKEHSRNQFKFHCDDDVQLG